MKHKTGGIIGEYELLLEVPRRRTHQWFGHTNRRPGFLAHDVTHGWRTVQAGDERPKGNLVQKHCRIDGDLDYIMCEREVEDRQK